MNDYTNLSAVLVWLASGGALLAANWIIANLLEKWDKWHAFPSWVKFTAPLVGAIVLAIGSHYALNYAAELEQVQPLFAIIVTIVVGYFGSQSGHMANKNIQAQQQQAGAQVKQLAVEKQQLAVDKAEQMGNAPQ